jgi:hypothetical protein
MDLEQAMRRLCRAVFVVFVVLYLLALGIFLIGTFGLFGSPSGPLAGIFLIPVGLPWNMMLDSFPEAARPWLASLAPLLNVFIIGTICRMIAAGKRRC